MDQRQTFDSLQKLKALLQDLYQQQEKVALLLDREGLTRMQGKITAIEEQSSTSLTTIILDQGNKFLLSEVIAVNGQFRSDYSEC